MSSVFSQKLAETMNRGAARASYDGDAVEEALSEVIGTPPESAARPAFVSGETISDSTIEVVFDQEVKSLDYVSGVHIVIDITPTNVLSGARQVDKTRVQYNVSDPITEGVLISFSYIAIDGFISNETGEQLDDVDSASITNNEAGGGGG